MRYIPLCFRRDSVFVVNCDPTLTMGLCALFAVAPRLRRPLVAVDLVLRRPSGMLQAKWASFKKALFDRVDHFIHYFKDLDGYQQVYGIDPARSSFVFFKPNIRNRQPVDAPTDGEYVLCLGRSMRDFATFFEAVGRLPYPAAITKPDFRALRAHGARFDPGKQRIPVNVRVLEDDGGEESQVKCLRGAKLVVLPILKRNMAASGISTALNAMLLGKCVIASEGPGISDVFTDELLVVPPEDPGALAAAIERAWEDDDLRRRTAEAARLRAQSLGGEAELYQRIVDQVTAWIRDTRR